MTDRELLEAAAKAAGVRIGAWQESQEAFYKVGNTLTPGGWWNPLTDDGDALRLAVKLRLSIMREAGRSFVQVSADNGGDTCTAFAMEFLSDDPASATRRAIVRVAAAMAA